MNTSQYPTVDTTIRHKAVFGGSILLIERSFQYCFGISRAFKELGLLDTLVISVDCENALMRLRQAGGRRPCLILLDLDMPQMSAMSFLEAVKRDENLRMVPVVVLAGTDTAEAVSRCYSLGAAGYMVKPVNYAELLDKITAFCSYWSLSHMPSLD